MREFCTYGSVRGASGNRRPYRDFVIFFSIQSTSCAFPEF